VYFYGGLMMEEECTLVALPFRLEDRKQHAKVMSRVVELEEQMGVFSEEIAKCYAKLASLAKKQVEYIESLDKKELTV
jgi:hypothetical protein